MSDTLTPAFITASAVLLGSVISPFSALTVIRRAAKAEEQGQRRMLGLEIGKLGFENAKIMCDRRAAFTKEPASTPCYEAFLAHGMRAMEIISDPGITPEEMGRRIVASEQFLDRMDAAAKKARSAN